MRLSSTFAQSRSNASKLPESFAAPEQAMTPDPDADMTLASGVAAYEAKEFRRAMQLLSPLAEQGDAQAQFRVAIMCQNALGGVANPTRAATMMHAAAQEGLGIAQHALGTMYLYGECVDKDESQAAQWFERAAEQGLDGALVALALLYEQGLGVPKDAKKAKALYARAGMSP